MKMEEEEKETQPVKKSISRARTRRAIKDSAEEAKDSPDDEPKIKEKPVRKIKAK